MSEKKNNLKNNLENFTEDYSCSAPTPTPQPNDIELNNNIYYNCSECNSLIEILRIDEKNNLIIFKCLSNNHENKEEQIITIKEYLEKMERYKNKNITDVCKIHRREKFRSYCFDCKSHLCNECIATKMHKNHKKNYILEEQPNKEDLNLIENRIKNYNNEIINLKIQKDNVLKEYKDKFNNDKLTEKIEKKGIK